MQEQTSTVKSNRSVAKKQYVPRAKQVAPRRQDNGPHYVVATAELTGLVKTRKNRHLHELAFLGRISLAQLPKIQAAVRGMHTGGGL